MVELIGFDNATRPSDVDWLVALEGEDLPVLDLPGPDIVAIRRSIDQFRSMMAMGNGTIHSASAAVLLYQHLSDAGFAVQFEANDHFGVVQAVSAEMSASLELANMVSDLLSDLSSFQTVNGGTGFTVRQISNSYVGEGMTLTVLFASYDAPQDDRQVPVLPVINSDQLQQSADSGADEDECELF